MTLINTKLPAELIDPSHNRYPKPRTTGITMVIDKGIGMNEYMDLLQLSSSYIDYIKLGFGTSALYPKRLLQKKVELAQRYQVNIYPGGTMTEIAVAQNRFEDYFHYLKECGFTTIEISEGTIDIEPNLRTNLIERALQLGFEVITELGKKTEGHRLDPIQFGEQVKSDLAVGVSYVIVEGRESGLDVGIYDKNGDANESFISYVQDKGLTHNLIWEAPQKKQQAHLIRLFGPNVNLGNIPANETIAVEALRRGLRSDTFQRI